MKFSAKFPFSFVSCGIVVSYQQIIIDLVEKLRTTAENFQQGYEITRTKFPRAKSRKVTLQKLVEMKISRALIALSSAQLRDYRADLCNDLSQRYQLEPELILHIILRDNSNGI